MRASIGYRWIAFTCSDHDFVGWFGMKPVDERVYGTPSVGRGGAADARADAGNRHQARPDGARGSRHAARYTAVTAP